LKLAAIRASSPVLPAPSVSPQYAGSGGELVLERADLVRQLSFLTSSACSAVVFAELELAGHRIALCDRSRQPAGGLRLHLLDVHLEPAHGHGEFGAQLILVSLDFRPRNRGQRFQATHGQAHRARMHQRDDADDEQPRDQEPDPDIHDRFDHEPS
jgi:hypothetical protein